MEHRVQKVPEPLTIHTKVLKIFAGANQTFIVTPEEIMAFGDNSHGQLGLPKFGFGGSVSQPTVVEGLSDKSIDGISTGPKHTVAWSSVSGDVFVCGDNTEGCLGLGDQEPHEGINQVHSFSEAASYGITVESVAVGEVHSLALAKSAENTSNQYIFGWGANAFNQLGDKWVQSDEEGDILVLVPHQMLESFPSPISGVYCYSTYSAVLTDEGEVYTWGRGDCSRLGYQPHLKQQILPKKVDIPNRIKKVSLGLFHALALTEFGEVYSWGSGASGQLGHEKLMNDKGPEKIAELASQQVVDIASGNKHCLALVDDGVVYAWGCNRKGQLGLDEVKGALKPKKVKTILEKLTAIAAGNEHSITLGESNRIYVFGSNSHGQLGISDKTFATPLKITGLGIKNISVSIPLHSIKEMSMENSTLIRKTDEAAGLKEYIWELEEKNREKESAKELLMSETLKFTSKIEKMAAQLQRTSHVPFGIQRTDPKIEEEFKAFVDFINSNANSQYSTAFFCLSIAEKFVNYLRLTNV